MTVAILVSTDSNVRSAVSAVCREGHSEHSWTYLAADSLQQASAAAGKQHSAVILIDLAMASGTTSVYFRARLQSVPHVVPIALISQRKIEPEEFAGLLALGFRRAIDCDVLRNPVRLRAILTDAAADLPIARVLSVSRQHVPSGILRLMHRCLRELHHGADTSAESAAAHRALLAELRKNLRPLTSTRAETFYNTCKLLLLVQLLAIRGQPLSRIFHLAGFRSADGARKMFSEYTGDSISLLESREDILRVELRLIEILNGRLSRARSQRGPPTDGLSPS
jgi:DNA-binding response OmpR family regulator